MSYVFIFKLLLIIIIIIALYTRTSEGRILTRSDKPIKRIKRENTSIFTHTVIIVTQHWALNIRVIVYSVLTSTYYTRLISVRIMSEFSCLQFTC